MSTDLDDMLSGSEAATPEAQPAPSAPEPAAVETGERSQEAAPPAASTEQHAEPGVVPQKALIEERRKRQDLERKLAELEAQRVPQRQEQIEAAPDWYSNPEQAAAAMQFEMSNRMYQTAVVYSEKVMKQQHEDYDEVSTIFAEVAKNDPALARQVFEHPFPAEFAYTTGKQIQLMRDIGNDPGAYRAKLEAEILAKHGITPGGNQPAPQVQRASAAVPRSLARDVSQQPRRNDGRFDGPASLDELLG